MFAISGKFEDEISKELKHTGAGILSMVRLYIDTVPWRDDLCMI